MLNCNNNNLTTASIDHATLLASKQTTRRLRQSHKYQIGEPVARTVRCRGQGGFYRGRGPWARWRRSAGWGTRRKSPPSPPLPTASRGNARWHSPGHRRRRRSPLLPFDRPLPRSSSRCYGGCCWILGRIPPSPTTTLYSFLLICSGHSCPFQRPFVQHLMCV